MLEMEVLSKTLGTRTSPPIVSELNEITHTHLYVFVQGAYLNMDEVLSAYHVLLKTC